MQYCLGAAALLAVGANACSELAGNWYCNQVEALTFTNVGGSGSYDRITDMDSTSGACSSTPQSYSGSIAPFDEEVSIHLRGPLILQQFAAYAPSNSTANTKRSPSEHAHSHGHRYSHKHRAAASGSSASETADSAGAAPAPAGDWTRTAYYSAAKAKAEGLVFLNHQGGSGSGVFDYTFGNSLSFASTDGTTGAASPQILANTTLPSTAEIVIMTNSSCGASGGDCGYYRPGIEDVAYHGFDGEEKAFFFEFSMPSEGGDTASEYDAINMPAIWMLNAQIPRTLQYGAANCSCWTTGCGEADIWEVLSAGYTQMKATIHGNKAGGSSNYIERPVSGSMKGAVVMVGSDIHIMKLGPKVQFTQNIASSLIERIANESTSSTEMLFSLD